MRLPPRHTLTPFASSLARGATLGSLTHSGLPQNPECAHEQYASLDDATLTHRAGFTASPPLPLTGLRIRFRPGFVPHHATLETRSPDGTLRHHALPPDALEHDLPLDGSPLDRVTVVLPPGGGSTSHPGVLRLLALAPILAPSDAPILHVERTAGRLEAPASPTALDTTGASAIDAGDALALHLTWLAPHLLEHLTFHLFRAGTIGDPARFAASLQVHVDGALTDVVATVDDRDAGLFAGLRALGLRLRTPRIASHVRVTLPPRPWPFPLRAVTTAPAGLDLAPSPPSPPAPPGAFPPRHAASLGLPDTDARIAIAPDGTWLLPLDGVHDRHLALSSGTALFERTVLARGAGLRQSARLDGVLVHHTLLVEGGASPCLHAHLTSTDGPLPPLALAVRAGPLPWPATLHAPDARSLTRDGRLLLTADVDLTVTHHRHESVLHFGGARAATLRLPLTAATPHARPLDAITTEAVTAFTAARHGASPFTAHDAPTQSLVDTLLDRANLFVQSQHRVAYGLFPSVYTGDVFGLEEDYLFRAVAVWGLPERALTSLRATYLTDEHLDARHYLHDLRRALTPWQTSRLLDLAGLHFRDLRADERDLLVGCGERILAARALTRGADGSPDARGIRVFPGLLPPFRFGGDLGFPTQSLHTDIASCVCLRELARMTGDARFTTAERDYRAAILAALDAINTDALQPLHTGGGDPGEYYELMVCGILDPLDFFAPDDPRRFRFDASVERRALLHRGLPRFDGWGTGRGIDAHYALGYARNLLYRNARDAFRSLLTAFTTLAMDPDVHTFGEVTPLHDAPVSWPEPFVPGRRLAQADPCVGGVGVALQLWRDALVTELPDAAGRHGRDLLLLAGLPHEAYAQSFSLERAPTLAGPVSLALSRGRLHVDAPGATSVRVVTRDGARLAHPGGHFSLEVV